MKDKPLRLFILLFVFSLVSLPRAIAEDSFRLSEIAFGTGYAFGDLKYLGDLDPAGYDLVREEDDFNVIPFFVSFGYGLNSAIGIEEHRGDLLFGLEPFINLISKPDDNVEAGLALFLKYDYPVTEKTDIYLEALAGPMYFGSDTKLQGDRGFAFLDQVGTGVKWHFADDKSVNLGYRFRHISNAGLREPNKAINSHAIIISLSKYY